MRQKAIGTITRGTTNPNRLRRVDRFIANQSIFRDEPKPLVVDLGFGANPTTSIELLSRLEKVNSATTVLGIEIDRERVAKAKPSEKQNLRFGYGGFETPLPEGLTGPIHLIRAMNVLRQYDEQEVLPAWSIMQKQLADNGLIVEGTCDEIGRLASWVTLTKTEVKSLTLSYRLSGIETPSKIAERLPKILIHRNTEGNQVHRFLTDLDNAWASNSSFAVFSPVQRFQKTCLQLIDMGWPLKKEPRRWRLGELTVAWDAIKP